MNPFQLFRSARRDLNEIWRHFDEEANADIADRVVDSLFDTILMLSRMPQAGRLRPDIGANLRSFVSGHYVIYYKRQRSRLLVVRILHGARDQVAARGRE